MVRMFLLGTLVPLVSLDSAARDVFQSLVSIIDLFGIYYAVNQTVGKPEIKVSYKMKSKKILWRDSSRFYRSWLAGVWQRVSCQLCWSIGMVPVNTNSLGNISTFRLIKILILFNSLQQLFWFGFGQDKVFIFEIGKTRLTLYFRLESKYGSSCIISSFDVFTERILRKSAFWRFCFDGKYFSDCNNLNILILTVFVNYCTLDQLQSLHLKCTCSALVHLSLMIYTINLNLQIFKIIFV